MQVDFYDVQCSSGGQAGQIDIIGKFKCDIIVVFLLGFVCIGKGCYINIGVEDECYCIVVEYWVECGSIVFVIFKWELNEKFCIVGFGKDIGINGL